MIRNLLIRLILTGGGIILLAGFMAVNPPDSYQSLYHKRLDSLELQLILLKNEIQKTPASDSKKALIRQRIHNARITLKKVDFWLRYFEPVAYKKLNGPLPVEWESEVFEKFEKPYKRIGKGLTLAELALENKDVSHDSLISLIDPAIEVLRTTYRADSITAYLSRPEHIFLCNRLFLLNLCTIYPTGFECPDTSRVIPEIKETLPAVIDIFHEYIVSFNGKKSPTALMAAEIKSKYNRLNDYLKSCDSGFSSFDRFEWIRQLNFIYKSNAFIIKNNHIKNENFNDYALNNYAYNLYDKELYTAQNALGIYAAVNDPKIIEEIAAIGKFLFYDPILSGNNQRSCANCHKPTLAFADTMGTTALNYTRTGYLKRNTPGLMNVTLNHLLMLDGKHYTLQDQAVGVITNPEEMNGSEKEILKKINNIPIYKNAFKKFQKYIPGNNKSLTLRHIASALTTYIGGLYSGISDFHNAFDGNACSEEVIKGFNLFMGKAQCGTCHFFPAFNGSKPPYIGSEFEVIGVPANKNSKILSPDSGRFFIHPAPEMLSAFRTPTLLNIAYTAPYMHNGVYRTLEDIIDFYDAGGGQGTGITLTNQTLSSDSLHLSNLEKKQLLAFLKSLNETHALRKPETILLPKSKKKLLNMRKAGGEY